LAHLEGSSSQTQSKQFCLDSDTRLGSHFASVEQPWLGGGGKIFKKGFFWGVFWSMVEREIVKKNLNLCV